MTTDRSSLPSVLDAKSKWEQLSTGSTASSSNGTNHTANSTALASEPTFSTPEQSVRPSFTRNTHSYTSASTATTSSSHTPSASPFLSTNFPNESAPSLSTKQQAPALKPKPPAIAPKPARLSSSFNTLSLNDKHVLAVAPEITVNGAEKVPDHHQSHSSSSSMGPPPLPPPSRPTTPSTNIMASSAPTTAISSPNPHKPIPPPPRSPMAPPPPPRPSSSTASACSPSSSFLRQSRVFSESFVDHSRHRSGSHPSDDSDDGGCAPESSLEVPPALPPRRVITPPENSTTTTSSSSNSEYFSYADGSTSGAGSRSPNRGAAPPPPPPRRALVSTSNPHLPLPSDTSSNGSRPSRSVSPSSRVAPPPPPPPPIAISSVSNSPVPLSQTNENLTQSYYSQKNNSNTSLHNTSEDDLEDSSLTGLSSIAEQEYPDSSQANRRAPIFNGDLHSITIRSEVRATASYGRYLCVSDIATRVFDIHSGECLWTLQHQDVKITASAFKIMGNSDDGKVLWLGTKEGQLWEVSTNQGAPVHKRPNCHLAPIVQIYRNDATGEFWTLSDDGKVCVWNGDLTSAPKTFRVTPNFKAFTAIGGQLWIGRTRQTSIYQPSLHDSQFAVTSRPIPAFTSTAGRQAGEFSCAGRLPAMPDCVLFGHEDGTVTIYSISKMVALESINVSTSKVCSLRGIGHYLWLGLKNGHIMVCDVGHKPWRVLKEWKAHDGPVTCIDCDDNSLKAGMLPVLTCSSTDLAVNIWDGLLKHDWIEMDMFHHDEEFSTFRNIDVHVVTWNAGAAKPSDLERNRVDNTFLKELLQSHGHIPDVIVFGFQELVELDNKAVTAKSMFSKRKRRDKDVSVAAHISHQYKAWQDRLFFAANEAYSGEKYRLVHSNNMVGLFTCVFLRESMMPSLQGIRSSVVKTGLGGLHGNKGGLAVRMILDSTSFCFVNCHLAAGQSSSIQRNKDIETILETQLTDENVNTEFTGKGIFVNGGDGTMILDHEICFFSGDMNYRINTQRPIAMRHLQDNELDKLLEMDQLSQQLKKNAGMRLRAFQEMGITFPPTYKFDVGTDNYDTSEKKRVPAWCDRVFYRGGKRITPVKYSSHLVRVSDHRPVSGLYKVRIKTIDKAKRNDSYKASLKRWNTFLEQAVEAAQF